MGLVDDIAQAPKLGHFVLQKNVALDRRFRCLEH